MPLDEKTTSKFDDRYCIHCQDQQSGELASKEQVREGSIRAAMQFLNYTKIKTWIVELSKIFIFWIILAFAIPISISAVKISRKGSKIKDYTKVRGVWISARQNDNKLEQQRCLTRALRLRFTSSKPPTAAMQSPKTLYAICLF